MGNFNKQDVEKYIDILKSQGRNRGDCPICYGKNTFSFNSVGGEILFYCFRANCSAKGKINYILMIDEIVSYRHNILNHDKENNTYYELPKYFVSPLSNIECFKYLSRYNLLNFYTNNSDRIRYCPKEHRCVFILKDYEGVIKGAVGRYLGNSSDMGRWRIYQRLSGILYVLENNSQNLVLVEDCVSASYLIQSNINSAAILGTNLPDDSIQYLLRYDKLYLMLDDDATNKAIQIQKQLSVYKPTFIIPIKTDPKYLSSDELKSIKDTYNL